MILENVTLEARARAQLSKRPSATAFSIADRMTRGGLLVEDIVVDEYAASSMTPRARHYLSVLRALFSHRAGEAISFGELRVAGVKHGLLSVGVITSLRLAWRAGEVRRFIRGIYKPGLSSSKLPLMRNHFETDEVYQEMMKIARKMDKKKWKGGAFYGVHYILYPKPGDKLQRQG